MPVVKHFLVVLLLTAVPAAAELRLGIVGTDTSHVIAFASLLNDPMSPDYVPGARITTAYKGGSKDLESSYSRVDKYADELKKKWNVQLMPDIASLCRRVDAVLLESVDGRPHLEQARQIIAAGKPMFIDKPLSATLEDAREIARLAKAAGVPWFSSSSLRFSDFVAELKFSDTQGAITWGPGPLEASHKLDLAWYAIHPIEMLYTIMGPGCVEVTRTYTEGADMVVGKWKDGRMGTVRATRPYGDYGAVVFRTKSVTQTPPKPKHSYRALLVEIIKFFETKQPPVPNEETLEMFAFMDAALRSKEAGGAPTKLR
ncbi:MAG: Gfo/Idh/MocA family protein [Bryobacteraceae bacterium]